MFEKKFLTYLLYTTLLEVRDYAYENNISRIYYLTDILHNTPFCLQDDQDSKMELERIIKNVEKLKISEWLSSRIKEFREQYPDIDVR